MKVTFDYKHNERLIYGVALEVNDIMMYQPAISEDKARALTMLVNLEDIRDSFFFSGSFNEFRTTADIQRYNEEIKKSSQPLKNYIDESIRRSINDTILKLGYDLTLYADRLIAEGISNITPPVIVYKNKRFVMDQAYMDGITSVRTNVVPAYTPEMMIQSSFNKTTHKHINPYPWGTYEAQQFLLGEENEVLRLHALRNSAALSLDGGQTLVLY